MDDGWLPTHVACCEKQAQGHWGVGMHCNRPHVLTLCRATDFLRQHCGCIEALFSTNISVHVHQAAISPFYLDSTIAIPTFDIPCVVAGMKARCSPSA